MRRYPLYVTHPQFSVFESNGYCEYRVENWHLSRDGNSKPVRGAPILTYQDAAIIVLLLSAFFWPTVENSLGCGTLFSATVVFLHVCHKCTQVLYESVVILPPHGIQLETHRGFPGLHLFATRRFIRLEVLQDLIIHEGMKGWSVHYYLAAVKVTNLGSFALEPAFKNLLPQHNVLLYVYQGIHAQLFRWGTASAR